MEFLGGYNIVVNVLRVLIGLRWGGGGSMLLLYLPAQNDGGGQRDEWTKGRYVGFRW